MRQNREFHEKSMPKWLQNHPKIDLLALGGLIFEILGGFWRRQIFDEFLICKMCAKNHKNQRLGMPKGKVFRGPAECAGSVGGDMGRVLRTLRDLRIEDLRFEE